MNVRAALRWFSCSLLLLSLASSPASGGDWLDVKVTEFKAANASSALKDGDQLQVECEWSLRLADDHSLWRASSEQRFPIRILAGGKLIGEAEAVIHAGTEIKFDSRDNFLEAPDFYTGPSGTVKATWTAKGPGFTKLECIVNEPKQISDQYTGNNRKSFQVSVTPAVQQPKNTWPTKEPKLEGTRRLPKTTQPAGDEAKGDATRRLPKAGLEPPPAEGGAPPDASGTPARRRGLPGS